ncbi:MAG TPA: DUF3644 domain-containing protein, partial [Pyrinomonadaceae bacterium]|nr:DUF3644 domain-containing protein [Pyrinomonadaceae bacterium]
MRKRKSPIALSLLRNSKSAMFAAVEIHNKPIFSYRYEISVMLVINAWELLLKAYIYKFLKPVKLFQKDGKTKPFDECLACVASNLGRGFQAIKESLDNLYIYRNKVTHFYCENLDSLLFSLIKANVGFYVEFVKKHFGYDLSTETNLILLPIGFQKPFSPIDFLSNSSALSSSSKEVKEFIEGIIESSKRLKSAKIKDSILVEYRMGLFNEKRINNADIVAAVNNAQQQSINFQIEESLKNVRITDDPNAKQIRLEEDFLFKTVYTEKYADVANEARKLFKDFLQNKKFNALMKKFRENSSLYKPRYIDPNNHASGKKDFYSKKIYEELAKYYQPKTSQI